jgi:diacylglycerol kinase (ATP)
MKDFEREGKPAGMKRIMLATQNSMRAFHWLLRNESAFQQELLLASVLTVVSLFLEVSRLEHVMLIVSLLILLLTEIINTAIESVVDRVSLEHHALSGLAKDLGSAAVFISLLIVTVTWAGILLF